MNLTSDPGEASSPKERASWLKTQVRLNGLWLSDREFILWLFANEIAMGDLGGEIEVNSNT
jgi:hypothetical protein